MCRGPLQPELFCDSKIQASYIQCSILNLISSLKTVLENYQTHDCLSFKSYSEVVLWISGVTCRTVVKNDTDCNSEKIIIDISNFQTEAGTQTRGPTQEQSHKFLIVPLLKEKRLQSLLI